jgi:molybdate transport system substrate-binding protein
MRWTAAFAALAFAILPAGLAHAEFVVAPDVVVYCEPTLRPALAEIAALWRHQTGVPVVLFTSPTAAILEQVGHHARADLVIGEGDDAAAAAAQRQIIEPDTLARLWRNHLVIAASGATAEPVTKQDGLAGPDRSARTYAVVDPVVGATGADSRQALSADGLWPSLEGQTVGVVSTADATFLLTEGRVQRAVVYATDVAAVPGLMVAWPLTHGYPPIVYWLAQTHNQLSPKAADFAAFLRQPPAQELARAAGLEPLP